MAWFDRIRGVFARFGRAEVSQPAAARGPVSHVIIIDGTMSSLADGRETNAGILYKLICEAGDPRDVSIRYEAGIQWQAWRSTLDVIQGRGINRQIRRVYGFLASRYRPGDRIFLFGYSRGAYAVRSLAGVIDRIGLLRQDAATERNIIQAYRHYRSGAETESAATFRRLYCHEDAPIEMVGVWDTVKALGFRWPVIGRWQEDKHGFHNHALGASVRNGFHALALEETRAAFRPILWETPNAGFSGTVEQVWFHGHHGIVGGQLGGYIASRPLSNIPLLWMLNKARRCGLPLPDNLQARYRTDPLAPMRGTWRGWGRLFLNRRRRIVGANASERLHPTALIWAAQPRPPFLARLFGAPDPEDLPDLEAWRDTAPGYEEDTPADPLVQPVAD